MVEFKQKSKLIFSKIMEIENILFILLIFIGILLRIPREPGIVGSDTFEIVWMAKAIVEGEGVKWLINPLSFFGFYPFSYYPLGLPGIIAFLLLIFKEVRVVAFILSSIFFIIGSYGAFKFSKLLFQDIIYRVIFIVSFSFVPLFYRFTYNTLNARAPIIALSIWLYYFIFKYWKTNKKRNILYSGVMVGIMVFFHRLWIIFFFLYIALIIAIIVRKYDKVNEFVSNNKKFNIGFLFFNIILMFASYYIFKIDTTKITNPWFENTNIFALIINLIIDYGLRLGPIIVFAIIEIYLLFGKKGENNDYYLLEKIMLCFVAFTWTYTKYNTVVFLPLYIIYSLHGLKAIDKKYENVKLISLILLCLIISLFYNILILNSSLFYIVILFVLIPVLFVFMFKDLIKDKVNNIDQKLLSGFLVTTIVSTIIFSLTVNVGLLSSELQEFPYYYITDEEKEVANFLINDGIVGAVYVSSATIAEHISSYYLINTIPGGAKSATQLYYNWLTPYEVRNQTNFDLSYFISNLVLRYSQDYKEIEILNTISSIRANTTEGRSELSALGIQYAIVLKNVNESISLEGIERKYHEFLNSLISIQISYETENLLVWKFYS